MIGLARVRKTLRLAVLLAAIAGLAPSVARAQEYELVPSWVEDLPRPLGSVSDVGVGPNGDVWLAERCGENDCSGQPDRAPVMRIAASGRWLAGFGAGMFAWPHGLHVDRDGNVWVTDGRAAGGRGHQVHKFAPDGTLLMTLGQAATPGGDEAHFNGPTDVVVAPNGDVFVSDGHETESNNRIVKFSADGRYLHEWGGTGSAPGRFDVPHALAMDSRGRLFVADRNNNRIQIFDQDGDLLEVWIQFGRPSGIYIDADDRLYVADNQSNAARNPGWVRGIRIGSAEDGVVRSFIPDPDFDPEREEETSAHGLAAGGEGAVYGAEVWSRTIKKYRPVP